MAETHKERVTRQRQATGEKRRATHERRKIRKIYGGDRQVLADARTPAEQLAMLDARLGIGVGAVKERNRLARNV
jgi:hypothetical protein